MARVIVVGSGVAGLLTAVRASRRHEVLLLTKGVLGDGSTRHAQGGVAVALAPSDSAVAHAADTLRAGAGLGDPAAVTVLCEEGPDAVAALTALGVAFDRDGDGLALGREAAHSTRRIVHAGGDSTGREIVRALTAAVRRGPVRVREHTALVDLVVVDGSVAGVRVRAPDGARVLMADAVVIATGGAGRLYPHTTNPPGATGDGTAAAYRAGAELADLEFYQFHPTALAVPGTPLVSEAVRGEGAVLRDEHGERFMLGVHPDAELAPRDVVARGIARAMAAQGGRPVVLDATALGAELVAARFPGVTAICASAGFDLAREPVPVTPAAHYWMGGVRTDASGRTSIPGLLAVGECARTGVHGANRLASNSLLEGAVFAVRAAAALDEVEPARARTERAAGAIAAPLAAPSASASASATTDAPAPLREELQRVLWRHVGLERDAAGLEAALTRIDALAEAANDSPSTARALEDRNLLLLGRLIAEAALAREESRGAHHRTDHPAPDPAQARSRVVTRQEALA